MPPGRLTLLVTSPRVAAGVLSRAAWQALERADTLLATQTETGQPGAIRQAGVHVAPLEVKSMAELSQVLLHRAGEASVVWIGSADGDPGLSQALASTLARSGSDAPEVELLVGSWDMAGGRLLDAVAVMDRLRSPGGCPWDAEQTHQSLLPYLVEETHEAIEALESGDEDHMVEELGDVLLQVLFHARVAAERGEDEAGFDIDDVAGRLVDKLVRRHPHVFAGDPTTGVDAVEANWERLKSLEKPHREHPLDGVPAGMPELARAAKVASRLERAGLGDWLGQWVEARAAGSPDDWGVTLLEVVLRTRQAGSDPAAALRAVLREVGEQVPGVDTPAARRGEAVPPEAHPAG